MTRSFMVAIALLASSPAVAQQALPTIATHAVEQWTVERDLVIGEPEVSLTTVTDLLIGPDGSIYVVQPDEQRIRQFAAVGEPRLSIGRRGRGPGEFQRPQYAVWRADTLVVTDRALGRLTAFTAQGAVHYTLSTLSGAAVRRLPRALLANGLMLAEQSVGSDDDLVDGVVTTRPLLLIDHEGSTVDTLAVLSFGAHVQARVVITVDGEPTYSYFTHPFPDGDAYDVDPDGRAVVVVSQVAGDESNPRFSVVRLSPSGWNEWSRSFSYTPQRVSAMTRDTLGALATKFTQHPAFRERVPRGQIERSLRRDIHVPSFLAPASDVVAGRDGSVWIRREPVSQDALWMVLDHRGTHIANARMPFGFRPYQADKDHVWGIELGEMDEPHVVRYRLRRAGET